MKKIHILLMVVLALSFSSLSIAQDFKNGERMTIGVTLHPYYSFVANIVGDLADIEPLIGAGYNPHNYNPLPEDLVRARSMDVIVVNGIGHDEWAFEILQASGAGDTPLIYANNSVSLIPVAGNDEAVNAHTFISTVTAIQQIYEIARELGRYDPDNAQAYARNGRAYATSLRRLKAEYSQQFADLDTSNFRAATMHGAYGYLLQEFGLQISAVIEPRHGVEPTARQLAQTIEAIRAANVNVLFAEKFFAGQLAETIQAETGVEVYSFSHISEGDYTPEFYESEMRFNLDSLKAAVESTAPSL
ncbi:MAG: ABC transporter substrate-binding protein [Gammaproteobacteria bacterium]|nr:ABC transporter substrate-binding protein [Gammaproteobacteria bacterium]|tara:strand:+ start:282 stop:1190 length:909 start_codon:yes stop_codon:yes gene_type:complete